MIRSTLSQHRRAACLVAGLASLGLVGYAIFWLQNVQGLQPCPLCIFQRVSLAALGVALLLAAVPPASARWALRLTAVLAALAALAAAGVALRHLWIMSQPPGTVPACGATLDYLMDVFTPFEVLSKVLTGSGECGKVDWSFLGIAMPGWVLIWAVLLGTVGVLAAWPRRAARAATA